MPPQFYDKGVLIHHAMEKLFNASGWEILSAIEKGFRAQVDVKGKLAEFFLYRQLVRLQRRGVIDQVDWRDQDGVADFLIRGKGREVRMECKNVRSGRTRFKDAYKVEIQKTRSQIGGGPARGYRVDESEILAACLFNQTGRWEYLFATTANLERRPEWPDYLVIMQRVPLQPEGHWRPTLEDVLAGLFGH